MHRWEWGHIKFEAQCCSGILKKLGRRKENMKHSEVKSKYRNKLLFFLFAHFGMPCLECFFFLSFVSRSKNDVEWNQNKRNDILFLLFCSTKVLKATGLFTFNFCAPPNWGLSSQPSHRFVSSIVQLIILVAGKFIPGISCRDYMMALIHSEFDISKFHFIETWNILLLWVSGPIYPSTHSFVVCK